MRRMSERGDTRLGTLVFFALLAAVGLAAWNVIPVYYEHYDLTDAVENVCRTPVYKARTPERIKEMLLTEVRNREMEQWVFPDSFKIDTTARNRRIQLTYEREVNILPGWKRVFKFNYTAEQPLI